MLEDADYVTGSAPTGTINFDAKSKNVFWYSQNATGDVTLNFRGDGNTTLETMMSATEVLTTSFVMPNGATAYKVASVTVDGGAPTAVQWAKWSQHILQVLHLQLMFTSSRLLRRELMRSQFSLHNPHLPDR